LWTYTPDPAAMATHSPSAERAMSLITPRPQRANSVTCVAFSAVIVSLVDGNGAPDLTHIALVGDGVGVMVGVDAVVGVIKGVGVVVAGCVEIGARVADAVAIGVGVCMTATAVGVNSTSTGTAVSRQAAKTMITAKM
jgi:hypothetical protein